MRVGVNSVQLASDIPQKSDERSNTMVAFSFLVSLFLFAVSCSAVQAQQGLEQESLCKYRLVCWSRKNGAVFTKSTRYPSHSLFPSCCSVCPQQFCRLQVCFPWATTSSGWNRNDLCCPDTCLPWYPCWLVLCAAPQCLPGEELFTPTDACCPICRNKCWDTICPQVVTCAESEESYIPTGDCCPTCRSVFHLRH